MTEQAHKELLADVLSRYEQSPNPRLREITEAAIRHLHAFVEEVGLSATSGSPASSSSPPPGRSATTPARSSSSCPTPSGCRRWSSSSPTPAPRGHREHRPRAVLRARLTAAGRGESMLVDPDEGDRVVIRGTVTDNAGRPIAGRRWTAGRTPPPASTPCSSPASSRRRTYAASTRPTRTAPTRSARSARCRTRSRSTGRSATSSRRTGEGGCGRATPTCG